MNASVIPLVLGGVLAAAGLALAVRAETARDRVAALALVAVIALFFAGPVLLWPCGEGDCGPIVPLYAIALAVAVAALLLALCAGRRRTTRG